GVEVRHHLATLQEHGLIHQLRVVPEQVYRFKHVLTQEVVYESLLAHQRRSLHESAGRAIEEIHHDRIEEQLELLTHHYSRAEIWAKAVSYGRESAEKTSRLGRLSEALAALERTEGWLSNLEQTTECKASLADVLLQQERLCETLGLRDRQQELIDRILSLADMLDDQALVAEALVRQGEFQTLVGEFDSAEKAFTRSLGIRRGSGDIDAERIVLRNMGFLYWRTGRYEDAVECNRTALAIDQSIDDSAGYAKDLTNLGSILRTQGRPRDALPYLMEALRISEVLSRPVGQVYTLAVLANVHRDLDEADIAMAYYRRADELAIQHHLPLHRVVVLSAISSICWERGQVEESLRISNDLVVLTRAYEIRKDLGRALETLGGRLIALNRFDEALPHLRDAADLFAEFGHIAEQARMLASIAYICERDPVRRDVAMETWLSVASLSRVLGDRIREMEALEGMARAARMSNGDFSLAVDCLRSARDIARHLGDAAKEGELLNTIGILEWTSGDYASALSSYEAALEIFDDLGDTVHAGLAMNSIGVTLDKLGRYDEAVKRLNDALFLHSQTGERMLRGHALTALGDVRRRMGEYEEAAELYRESLEIRREQSDRNGEAWMLCRLAQVLSLQSGANEARTLLDRAVMMAHELTDDRLIQECASIQLGNRQED
ncbi:MAG TPA: tetratricopeptide repeat protein, partial [Blastocatellia bacterium]|nr:tetratricopeptide repeat protein [Blastocatellia bacterium]